MNRFDDVANIRNHCESAAASETSGLGKTTSQHAHFAGEWQTPLNESHFEMPSVILSGSSSSSSSSSQLALQVLEGP